MGSVVKSLLAVYRLQGGRASRLRAGFARGLEVVPTTLASRSPPRIAAEPTRTYGVLTPQIESDCATVSSTQALLLQRRISAKML